LENEPVQIQPSFHPVHRQLWRSNLSSTHSGLVKIVYLFGDRRGRDRMVVGLTATCAISAYYH